MAKARIMVVEDEGVVAMSIRESLQGLGYEVPVVAMTGEDALNRLLETEPDLVLMDIHLKGGASGIETAQRIRQRLDVPVIYLTAYSDAETLEQAQLTEPYGYVLKPFDERSLHAIIQMSLLKHRRTRTMRENGWWMSAVAESMMEAVVICDPKGYIKFANPASETLLGKVKPEMIEKRLAELVRLIDADSHADVAFPVTRAAPGGEEHAPRELPPRGGAEPRDPRGAERLAAAQSRGDALRDPVRLPRDLRARADPDAPAAGAGGAFPRAEEGSSRRAASRSPGCAASGCSCRPPSAAAIRWGASASTPRTSAFFALDVIGQGIFPALFSLLLHTFLSPHIDRGGMLVENTCEEPRLRALTPAEVVKGLNRRFYLREESNPYFTLAYGVLEPATGTVRIVRAGHPFPIHQAAGGQVQMVKPEGYAVGLFPGADVASEEIHLSPGDRLILYSDGLVDCTNAAGTRYTSARLVEKIKACRGMPLAALVDALHHDLVAWRGSESFADDVSLLALEKE